MFLGAKHVMVCDSKGIICEGDEGLNSGQEAMSHITNKNHEHGTLADAMKNADVFIGVSRAGLVSKEMVASAKEYGCTCKGNGRIFKEKWLQAQSFSMQPLARKMQLFP